jgi:integrase
MARKRTPGLYFRSGIWHIDKVVLNRRICESTGSGELEEAERYLARRCEEIRQAAIYGVRPKRLFRDAATKFLTENLHKRSIADDASRLKYLDKYIGHLALDNIHMGTLQDFIDGRKKEGRKSKTINHGLKVVRRILNLASDTWQDEFGLSWILKAPKITLLPEDDCRKPRPLTWDEQTKLFKELPAHLATMALFAVNTGTRDQEVCKLKWEWEIKVLELNTTAFIIPARHVKNKHDRLVVLNKFAKSVIDSVRGVHSEYVFTYRGRPITRMLNSAWIKARERAELLGVRVHDLKHTFGRRLRAAGVSFEDRQDLLGHKSGRITTHYSAAEIGNLIEAANKVCDEARNTPLLTVIKKAI